MSSFPSQSVVLQSLQLQFTENPVYISSFLCQSTICSPRMLSKSILNSKSTGCGTDRQVYISSFLSSICCSSKDVMQMHFIISKSTVTLYRKSCLHFVISKSTVTSYKKSSLHFVIPKPLHCLFSKDVEQINTQFKVYNLLKR